MQPSEFWALPVADWWAEFDGHVSESRRMEEKMGEMRTGKKGGAFSKAEWDAARKRHSEKMRAMT